MKLSRENKNLHAYFIWAPKWIKAVLELRYFFGHYFAKKKLSRKYKIAQYVEYVSFISQSLAMK